MPRTARRRSTWCCAGSGEIEIDGERHPLDPETMVRVAPGTTRKVFTGEEPIRMVIVGGIPGQAYEAPEVSQLGAPDPGIPRHESRRHDG